MFLSPKYHAKNWINCRTIIDHWQYRFSDYVFLDGSENKSSKQRGYSDGYTSFGFHHTYNL